MSKYKQQNLSAMYAELLNNHPELFTFDQRKKIRQLLKTFYADDNKTHSQESTMKLLHVVRILLDEIGLGRTAVLGVLLHRAVEKGQLSVTDIDREFNTNVATIIQGLIKVEDLYKKNTSLETENFRKLLLTFAEDVRVILIIIAKQLCDMRTPDNHCKEKQLEMAKEGTFLYAPLAHRMGLYSIKGELEDLSLKYTNREMYNEIASKLNESKQSRDRYIADFIEPLKEKMTEIGVPFEIKGRTKSIFSICNKMKKQNTEFENIYDLFAIRIIIDAPAKREKAVCWQAYSIVTDLYQPNPKRLRDWLSVPKSNGYESLHTTVLGPEEKWVEVQIRTVRMDDVAEKGLAAHWKYKGIKSESGMDEWLKNIREILENPELNAIDFMDEFKLNLYDREVFVFTPNGDLHRLPKGATVLDFAFSIHTELGTRCVGAKVNNRNVPMKYILNNGDQVAVLTAPSQKPNLSWLNIVVTSRAKNKIRQALKETEFKDAEYGRELLLRRFKNWKLELEDGKISRLAKKKGYKTVSDFYQAIANEKLDLLHIKDTFLELEHKDAATETVQRSAETFSKETPEVDPKEDVLVIDEHLKNVDFKLAKCCNPIYGDQVFGFVTAGGGIKIHKEDCPNAPQMKARFEYRIVKAAWSGKSDNSQYPVTLRIVGNDDIGIVTNITSLISKESAIRLRSISIDSNAGLFQGNVTVMVNDTKDLNAIIKKIGRVKGVKNVART
ncbi:MAG: RelA/SpoT family protein [Prevotellaceae bacterium]|jgi:GTP pyrophosphokinase|nr:RelA/SpoT family protein [Prevotellaceae bacterium]